MRTGTRQRAASVPASFDCASSAAPEQVLEVISGACRTHDRHERLCDLCEQLRCGSVSLLIQEDHSERLPSLERLCTRAYMKRFAGKQMEAWAGRQTTEGLVVRGGGGLRAWRLLAARHTVTVCSQRFRAASDGLIQELLCLGQARAVRTAGDAHGQIHNDGREGPVCRLQQLERFPASSRQPEEKHLDDGREKAVAAQREADGSGNAVRQGDPSAAGCARRLQSVQFGCVRPPAARGGGRAVRVRVARVRRLHCKLAEDELLRLETARVRG